MRAIILFFVATLFSCKHEKQALSFYQPAAQLCYEHDICVMRITDHRGEEFVMNYKYYRKLFVRGGYNTIVREYYQNPGHTAFQQAVAKPYLINTKDADSVKRDFLESYMNACATDTVFEPNPQTINRALARRKYMYKDYNPSTAFPKNTNQ